MGVTQKGNTVTPITCAERDLNMFRDVAFIPPHLITNMMLLGQQVSSRELAWGVSRATRFRYGLPYRTRTMTEVPEPAGRGQTARYCEDVAV